MIRKPPAGHGDSSRTVETVREIAETSGRVIQGSARIGRKTGAFASAGCLSWLAFGSTIGVLATLSNHTHQMLSVRGIFATLIMLAIPGVLIALTIWQVKRARSI